MNQGQSQQGYPQQGYNQQPYPPQYQQQPQYQQREYQSGYQQPQYQQGFRYSYPQGYAQQAREPEQKPPKKKKGGLRILLIIVLFIFIAAFCLLGYIFYTYWAGQHEYDELTEYMQVDDKSGNQGMLTLGSFDVDWDALRAKNPDIVGWVYLPGTIINYPIVWRENDDTYYTTHTFGDNSIGTFGAEYGAIALSGANSPDWTDQANFISGHHMRNKSMFAILYDFQNSETFNQHRVFYVLTPEGNFRMTSFACDKVRGDSEDVVIPNFGTDEEFRAYLQKCIDESKATPDPAYVDAYDIEQIFGFYTCSEPDNQYRIMVYCSVDEFMPADGDETLSNSLVEQDDLSSVQDAVGERLL